MKISRAKIYHFLCWIRALLYNLIVHNVKIGKRSMICRFTTLNTFYGGKITIGQRCFLNKYSQLITYGGDIEIGDNCSVNQFAMLYGNGNIRIGNGVRIAAFSSIISFNHNFKNADKWIYSSGVTANGIDIEDDVWIGNGAKIMDGVTIAKGCVIGANAVVTHTTEPYGIYVGAPAKLINKRRSSNDI